MRNKQQRDVVGTESEREGEARGKLAKQARLLEASGPH